MPASRAAATNASAAAASTACRAPSALPTAPRASPRAADVAIAVAAKRAWATIWRLRLPHTAGVKVSSMDSPQGDQAPETPAMSAASATPTSISTGASCRST